MCSCLVCNRLMCSRLVRSGLQRNQLVCSRMVSRLACSGFLCSRSMNIQAYAMSKYARFPRNIAYLDVALLSKYSQFPGFVEPLISEKQNSSDSETNLNPLCPVAFQILAIDWNRLMLLMPRNTFQSPVAKFIKLTVTHA